MDFTETPYAEDLMADLSEVIDQYEDSAGYQTIAMVLQMLLDEIREAQRHE